MERRSVPVDDQAVLSILGHLLDSDHLLGLLSRCNWRRYFLESGVRQYRRLWRHIDREGSVIIDGRLIIGEGEERHVGLDCLDIAIVFNIL